MISTGGMAVVAAILVLPASAVAAERYVSPSGSGGACSAAAPCGSFEAAYAVAQPGDVVIVAGGTYPRQVVPSPGKPAPAIEFRAADGASVVAAGIDVRADNVVMRGMRSSSYLDLDSSNAADPIENVRFVNMHTNTHLLLNARDFVWQGGSIGPSFNEKASMIGGSPPSYRATYDSVLWHDATRNSADVHMECFYVTGIQGLTIRNSRFSNCAVFDLLLTKLPADPQPRDVLIENTVFERSRDVDGSSAYYSFMVHQVANIDGFVLRNNVWELPFVVLGSVSNARAVGNIGLGDCQSGVRYSHNVFTGGRCAPTDKVVGDAFSQFVNRAAGDWRLKAGAAAIDAGDPADHPSLDALGHARPFGGGPDAGPYEFGAGPPGGSPGPGQPPSSSSPLAAARRRARVLRVIDGRTLRVKLKGGRRVKVRLAGVAVPRQRSCGGRRAAARLRAMAPKGSQVAVTFQTGAKARDRRGRRYAYVHREGKDLGKRLIAKGWARFAGPATLTRRAGYQGAQRRAKRRSVGLWARCG
jgi:endonuclease YncB( thermonuclease family)